MFYFTCNESKIYESCTFWNKLQEKKNAPDAPVYLTILTFLFQFFFFFWELQVINTSL